MMHLLSGAGLHYNEKANVPGAQTERRGEAWAGEELAWRQNLTGRCF
jgi:ribosomal protein L4